MRKPVFIFLLGIFIVFPSFVPATARAALTGDPRHGGQLYRQRCTACHDMDNNRTGPASRYIFGRQAGTGPDFEYSKALQSSGIVWNENTLDQWLKNPAAFLPGQKMFYMTNDPQDRADIIAYLKQSALHR